MEILLTNLKVLFLTYLFIAQPVQVAGNAMFPSYPNKAYLFVRRLPADKSPRRGDVIQFHYRVGGESFEYLKRVVGVPGDTLEISDGKVYVNGSALEEPYLAPNTKTQSGRFLQKSTPIVIPADKYIVMGDNRQNSNDSRNSGFVSAEDIIGKVWFCYNNCKSGGK